MNKLVLLNFLTMRNSINGLQQSPESSTSFFCVISNYKGDSSASSHFSQGVSVVVATLLKTRILWAMERALGLEYLLYKQVTRIQIPGAQVNSEWVQQAIYNCKLGK